MINFFVRMLLQADSIFAERPGERPLRDRLTETADLSIEVLELTRPGRGSSLLPVDLNSTNDLLDGIVGLLDDTLNTTENVTGIPNQVLGTCMHVTLLLFHTLSLPLSLSVSLLLSLSPSASLSPSFSPSLPLSLSVSLLLSLSPSASLSPSSSLYIIVTSQGAPTCK